MDLHSAPGWAEEQPRRVPLCEVLCRLLLRGSSGLPSPPPGTIGCPRLSLYSLSFSLVSISTYFSVPTV